MARDLKQSTAKTFRIGPFLDSLDGKTPKTGLAIGQADIQISKNGGAFAQTSASSPTTTHDVDGWYQCPLTATDTDTLGMLTVQIDMAGAGVVWDHFMVVPAVVFDSLVAGSDNLQVDAVQFAGQTITAGAGVTIRADVGFASPAADIRAAVGLGSDNLDVQLSAISGPVNTTGVVVDGNSTQNIAAAVWLDVTGAAVSTNTGATQTLAEGANGFEAIKTETAAIKAKTDNLPASPAAVGSQMGLSDGAITDAKIATDAITGDKVAASAVTKVQNGLATGTAQTTAQNDLDIITGADGAIVASASKTGYGLASTGLDSISTTAPAGVAANFREMLVQLWRRFFKRSTKNLAGDGAIKTYADNGTTVVTTQTVTGGTNQDVGAAS